MNRTVRKGKSKPPDPGAYGKDDITPEDRERGKDAKRQAASGKNPPSWVADESTWTKAKDAVGQSYEEGDDAYWPAVVHVYGNMGGEIQSKAKKAAEVPAAKSWTPEMLKTELGAPMSEFHRALSAAVFSRWGKNAFVRETYPESQVVIVQMFDQRDGGELVGPYGGASRLLQVDYELENGEVYLGDVVDEVHETFEPVGKSEAQVTTVRERRVFTATRQDDGRYSICGLNGEARALAKALEATDKLDDVTITQRPDADHENEVLFRVPGSDAREVRIPVTLTEEVEVRRARLLKTSDADELGIITLLVYEPDTVDGQGEYATESDIRDAAHEYISKRVVKRQHAESADGDKLVESWTLDRDEWYDNRLIRKGAWLVRVKMGAKSRKLYKDGKINGASMGGYCCVA